MSGEKTEQPTQRRLEEARRRGELPKSPDVSGAVALLAGLLALQWSGGRLVASLESVMRDSFRQIGVIDLSAAEAHRLGIAAATAMVAALLPVVGTVALAGVVANLAQTRGVVTFQPLAPDPKRINPILHLKQMLSGRSLFELAKAFAKLGIVGVVAVQAFADRYLQLVSLTGADLRSSAATALQIIVDVAVRASVAFCLLAVGDYVYQRWTYQKRMRMTKQELREELRQSDGNPEVKAAQRTRARRLARSRMMTNVPKADVVITNPTHFAIAIAYDGGSMQAPRVLAKGADHLALRIRELARLNNVPIVENRPLAQALYKLVEVDAEVPAELFEAVAEVLAFVFALRQRRRRNANRGRGPS